ncbi:MAG: flavodoxin [Oscillospiraceae bacterium]
MEKIIPLLFSALMLLSLAACGSKTTTPETTTAPAASGKTLVIYFSATGNTKAAAEAIAAATGGDLLELEPAEPYTSADLDYNNAGSRVSPRTQRRDPTRRGAQGHDRR